MALESIIQIVEEPECVILEKSAEDANIAAEGMEGVKTPLRIRATSIPIEEIS